MNGRVSPRAVQLASSFALSARRARRSIRELLAMDLVDARAKLGITPAVWYKACHDVWRSEGIDPYDLLGKAIPEKKLAA